MLSSLEIKNFKGIKSGTISDLAQVNILVGRNNSGKSTILDALLLMRCAFAVTDHLGDEGLGQILNRRVYRGGSLNYRELHYMLNAQERIHLKVTFPDGVKVTQEWEPTNSHLILTCETHNDTWVRGMSVGNRLSVENFSTREDWTTMASRIGDESAKLLALGHLLDSSSLRAPFLEKVWETVVSDRSDARLRNMVNQIYELDIENFSHMPFFGQNRVVALLPERSVAIDWLGDGLRYALNILALGMILEGTILMVEEVETHQHPQSLKLLTQTLFELAKKQNLQLFLTTHSLELMTYALEAAEEKDVGLAMHHVRLNEKGEFDARSFSQPDAKLLTDIGHDIRLQDKYIGAR